MRNNPLSSQEVLMIEKEGLPKGKLILKTCLNGSGSKERIGEINDLTKKKRLRANIRPWIDVNGKIMSDTEIYLIDDEAFAKFEIIRIDYSKSFPRVYIKHPVYDCLLSISFHDLIEDIIPKHDIIDGVIQQPMRYKDGILIDAIPKYY